MFSGKLGHQGRQDGSSTVGCALKELRVPLLNSVWEHLFLAMTLKLGVEASLLGHDSQTPCGNNSSLPWPPRGDGGSQEPEG